MEIGRLYNESENFLSSLQAGDDDSEIDEDEINEENVNLNIITPKDGLKKRKKFKNVKNNQWKIVFLMIVIAIIIEGFFVLNYILEYFVDQKLEGLVEILHDFTSYISLFYEVVNSQRYN